MKTFYSSSVVLFILISFSILFVSCSQESGITTPNVNNGKALTKTAELTSSSINHSLA